VSLKEVIARTKAYYCLECGICTGTCPVSRYDPDYSPRVMVENALLFEESGSLKDRRLWTCLTCGTCNLRCPSTVDYTAFMAALREKAREIGETGTCTHADTIAAIGALQMRSDFRKPKAWLGKGIKVKSRGRDYYFGGCLPFLDVVFRDIGFRGRASGNAAVRLLNAAGIVPVVGEDEVCCGHDPYWTGDWAAVEYFARRNVASISKSGARRVIFSCPEGYHMFKHVYPEMGIKLDFEPVHILTVLAENVKKLKLKPVEKKVTYHDPCRLVKFDYVFDAPRDVLAAIPGLEVIEMGRTGRDALCCGSSNWMSCTRVNKRIQVERLNEALDTGADALVTSCPKCNIHLRCAARDEDAAGPIEIVDILTLLAESLGGGRLGT
jgi:heterodisulfide reductase subunit D